MGWEALKNGALLDQAQSNGFDVMITVDQNVRFQQNLRILEAVQLVYVC